MPDLQHVLLTCCPVGGPRFCISGAARAAAAAAGRTLAPAARVRGARHDDERRRAESAAKSRSDSEGDLMAEVELALVATSGRWKRASGSTVSACAALEFASMVDLSELVEAAPRRTRRSG